MKGFERAQREYEHWLTSPYDEGGALYEYEEEQQKEDWLETQADYQMERMFLGL